MMIQITEQDQIEPKLLEMIGIDEHVARFEKDHDDYSAIVLKALADRLAEALAAWRTSPFPSGARASSPSA